MSGIDILILRLDAPLLAFGGVAVDERRPSEDYPARSMLTGLLANALGWEHKDWLRLDRLQARLRHATRRDRAGTRLDDFHTVDLGQDFMLQGWTTRGRVEGRGKGAATKGTHIRDRRFWADAAYTIAITLDPTDEAPTLDDLANALVRPERPLFLGRKACLPSRPLVADGEAHRLRAPSLVAALERVPRWTRDDGPTLRAWWSDGEPSASARVGRVFPAHDQRDWRNQIHVGRRFLVEGELTVAEDATDA